MLPVPRTMLHPSMTSTVDGLKAEYFASDNFEGKPVVTRVDRQIDFDWNSASPGVGVPANTFAVRWTGVTAVPEAGEYDFAMHLAYCYPCDNHEKFAVFVDDRPVAGFGVSMKPGAHPDSNPRFTVNFPDTKRHHLKVEYMHNADLYNAGITMTWAPKLESL